MTRTAAPPFPSTLDIVVHSSLLSLPYILGLRSERGATSMSIKGEPAEVASLFNIKHSLPNLGQFHQ